MGNLCTCFSAKPVKPTIKSTNINLEPNTELDFTDLPSNTYIAKFNYTAINADDISFNKDDCFEVLDDKLYNWWKCRCLKTKKEGFIPSNYVAKFNSLENHDWYVDKMSRTQAERLLLRMGIPGAFIVRVNERGDYSLSLRDADSIKHYRIYQENGKFTISKKKVFTDLEALVRHYKKSDGLSRTLKVACPQIVNIGVDQWEVPRERIELMGQLGKGNFAEVREGRWNDTIKVAVKILKSDKMKPEKFLQEAAIMKQLNHKRLVQLYAVCTIGEGKPIYIVLEYLAKGNLLEYLRTRDGHKLRFKDQLDIGAQVADGLQYLEENDIIHRDIAARNILVGENNQVKVADFGLSKLAHTELEVSENPCAIKWTAPEAILRNLFTTKSDVWSFGILLYEIITKGKTPYESMNKDEAFQSVVNGYRMPAPKDCPEKFHNIMLECWFENPEKRPGFERLKNTLEEYTFPLINEQNETSVL